MSRLTFENRRDYPSCRDQLFFILVEIFKIEIFQSRLCRVEIFVKICQDASRFSRFVETLSRFVEKSRHCRSLLSLKMMKSLDGMRNLDEKIQKSTHFSIEIETNCRNAEIFRSQQNSRSRFFGLDVDVETKSRYLDRRDLLFDAVEIFSTVETHSLTTSRSRVSIETTSRQIETPKVRLLSISI